MQDTLSPQAAEDVFGDPSSSAIAPVAVSNRIDTLDFIRGIAVMGILWANIVAFGQPMLAYFTPGKFLVPTGDPDGWMWIVQFILIDGKMRGLFTVLFGAGMVLFMEKAWARGATRWLQAWRLVLLLGFGLIHFYFVWFGDILSGYAILGLIALTCMKWRPRTQLWVGLAGYMLGAVFYAFLIFPWLIISTDLGASSPEFGEMRAGMIAEMQAQVAAQEPVNAAIASGDYAALVAHRIGEEGLDPFLNAFAVGLDRRDRGGRGAPCHRVGDAGRRVQLLRHAGGLSGHERPAAAVDGAGPRRAAGRLCALGDRLAGRPHPRRRPRGLHQLPRHLDRDDVRLPRLGAGAVRPAEPPAALRGGGAGVDRDAGVVEALA